MDDKTLQVYQLLAENDLQSFYSSFNQTLKVYQKRDFIILCREDLQKVGLTTRSSFGHYEKLLESVKSNSQVGLPTFDFSDHYIHTLLPNQEPVIISENDISQQDILGTGHFGKVYKGSWQRRLHDGKMVKVPVAIKTITDGKEMSWKTEVSIFTALNQNHSNIIKFLGLLIGGTEVRMVTEFAPYGSLLDRLRSKEISCVATLSQFAAQISSGMVYLHSRNLVHRDLSARNILVTGKKQVKISDFGLSKVLNDTQTEWVMDSSESLPMRWLAPESLTSGVFTSASDVWSYAVVLWEMFTFGDSPWGDLNNEQVKQKIQNGECLPEPRFCPDEIYEVIKMCMTFDQCSRPPFHIIHQEVLHRQPRPLEAIVVSNGPYDLNFAPGDFITSIKMLRDQEWWLGQHENTLQFGRFRLEQTKTVSYTIPYSLNESQEEEQRIMAPKGLENKENLLYESHQQHQSPAYQHKEVSYVNLDAPPLQPIATTSVNKDGGQAAMLKPENKSLTDLKQQFRSRPHSAEVVSMREDFFDLTTNNLKSGSDSNLGFKDTNPEVQDTVNDRITKNMTAFLSFTNPLSSEDVSLQSGLLNPVNVSNPPTSARQNRNWSSIDPLSSTKAASCENLYEEIDNEQYRSGRNTQTLRPRPKANLPIPQETNAAYRKTSLDAYAQSIRKDFDLLSQQLGPRRETASCDNLPESISSLNVSVNDVKNYPSVQNTQYLQRFGSVIPVSQVNQNMFPPQQANTRLVGPSHQPPQQPPTTGNLTAEKSPDYFKNFLADQKTMNHFTYDPKAKPKQTPSPPSAKEKLRQNATNFTDNQWDLFEDCVKGSKKVDKDRKKSQGKRISWPKNNSGGLVDITHEETEDQKGEFSEKFKTIRSILPDASVGECLEGLRSSGNDVNRAVRYIQILKLYRFNYGYSFEDCEKLLEKNGFDFKKAECELKTCHVCGKFQSLDRTQVQDTLSFCQWDVTLTLKTIFIQKCGGFGIEEPKARSLFNENKEDVTKALEMAKIVRVAEITSKPENVCFKTLTRCKWNIERAVNEIFTNS
ncbi:receptor tyrosine-protein kinase erbB-4-like isoform X2 [Clytia hemisphaerica]|uniref:Protein kinase domain-containing protein n=1 Tax=Clytia hemisphaerica TaxID=252671 RepID=A0A7M5V3Q0_9CNID